MFQALTELQLLTVRIIVCQILAIAVTLTIQHQLKCVQVIIKVHLLQCFLNSHQLIQLRIKEKELHNSKNKSKRCRSSRDIVLLIVVLIHNKWLQLRFINNKCTRQHRLLQQFVRRKYAKVSKMYNNTEMNLRSKSSASTHTISSPAQFTSTVLNLLNYPQKLYSHLIKRKWWWWINRVLKWIPIQAQFIPSNKQLHIKHLLWWELLLQIILH